MDRKAKHRILGVLVVIGLVIILLPLFQGGKEPASEASLVKAPPFPDQSVQVTPADTVDAQNSPAAAPAQSNANPPLAKSVENNTTQQPDDTININRPSVINAQVPAMPGTNNSVAANTEIKTDLPKTDLPQKPARVEKKAVVTELPPAAPTPTANQDVQAQVTDQVVTPDEPSVAPKKVNHEDVIQDIQPTPAHKKALRVTKHDKNKIKSLPIPVPVVQQASLAPTRMDNNGLFSLKNAAWVIQMGSFKNKANALRLVNQLRANGYKAFIQRISTALGENTRVFVGPEYKQTSARALASRLETDLHLKGIVISYKPLAL